MHRNSKVSARLLHPCILLSLLSAVVLHCPATAHARLGVEEVLATHSFRELAVSSDGHWLVYALRGADEKENRRVDELWRVDLTDADAGPVLLVKGKGTLSTLRWSPKGARLGFLMKRGEKAETQVWAIAPDGGEAQALTKWEPGVEDFRWAGDGRIYFTAKEKKSLRDRELEKKKDDTLVVEDVEHWPKVRLFALDPSNGKSTRLVDDDRPISGFWISPDGRRIVTKHHSSIYHNSQLGGPWPVYLLHDLDANEQREIFAEPTFAPSHVAFTRDGRALLAQTSFSSKTTPEFRSGAGIETLWYYELEGGELTRVDNHEYGLANHLISRSWELTERGVVAILADRVHGFPVLFEHKKDAWRRTELDGPEAHRWVDWQFDHEGKRVAWVHSAAASPEQLWLGELHGKRIQKERLLCDPDEKLRSELARSDPYYWSSSLDSVEISGILHWPKEYEEGRRYPLMLWIHGGPTGVDADRFENYWASFPHLLSGMGCFVLQPNYRGSVNHGLDYVEAITEGKYYELELPDILDGVDQLISEGLVHPDSLGTMGWSNGAILSIALTVETDRFQVCCAGAGDVNWTSDFGNCAFGPNFDVGYFGTTPWEDPQFYVDKSPLFRMEEIRTPTLIQFGEKDTSVPTSQGWEHYRAMQILDQAPVRFLIYPGQGHGLRKLSYQRRKMEEEIAWIQLHLFGHEQETEEFLKEGSPLSVALAREDLAGSPDAWIGEMHAGVRVPPLGKSALSTGARMARIELTCSILAEALSDPSLRELSEGIVGFDGDVAAYAARGNLPATGMGFEFALAYADWLSRRSGQNWRLPTLEEMDEALEATPRSQYDNNLCRWAGYEPTFDEGRAIRQRMVEASSPERWLLPVGNGDPEAEWLDLHGNASEYVLVEAEGGSIGGESVLMHCDEAIGRFGPWASALVGIRLVQDPPVQKAD